MKTVKHRFKISLPHPPEKQNTNDDNTHARTHTHTTHSFNLEESGNIFGLFTSYKK